MERLAMACAVKSALDSAQFSAKGLVARSLGKTGLAPTGVPGTPQPQ